RESGSSPQSRKNLGNAAAPPNVPVYRLSRGGMNSDFEVEEQTRGDGLTTMIQFFGRGARSITSRHQRHATKRGTSCVCKTEGTDTRRDFSGPGFHVIRDQSTYPNSVGVIVLIALASGDRMAHGLVIKWPIVASG